MKRKNYKSIATVIFAFALALSSSANTAIEPAPKGEKWLERHQQMAARAAEGDIDLLFLGDSITDYWPKRAADIWEREFGSYKYANFGISADRTQHLLWRLMNGAGEGFQPKVVVLLIGTNNTGMEADKVTPRNSTDETIQGIRAVVTEIRHRFPQAKLLLFGLFPRGDKDAPQRQQIATINQDISELHDGESIFYYDIGNQFLDGDGSIPETIMPDKLHPAEAGYAIWANALRAPLQQHLQQ